MSGPVVLDLLEVFSPDVHDVHVGYAYADDILLLSPAVFLPDSTN